MIDAVVIEGVRFPVAYNGYTYSRNKIWSGEQALLLDNVVSDVDNPFPTAQVLFLGGTQKEMTIYTGDVTYPYLTRAKNEDGLIVGAKLSLIQK